MSVNNSNAAFSVQTNPFAQLDLADYACQEVDISFAVVNKVGQSNFSDSVQFFVHGKA